MDGCAVCVPFFWGLAFLLSSWNLSFSRNTLSPLLLFDSFFVNHPTCMCADVQFPTFQRPTPHQSQASKPVTSTTSSPSSHRPCESVLSVGRALGVSVWTLEFTGESNEEGYSVKECLVGGTMDLREEELGLRSQVRFFFCFFGVAGVNFWLIFPFFGLC